ncbi:MAG: STAS domain-containing protein [Pseudomonadota bacterium]
MSLEIKDERVDDALVIIPVGRVDSRTAGEFETHVIGAITNGEKKILFDLSELVYLSSAGLRVLLMAAKRLRGGGKLAVCSMSDGIRQVFEIGGFTKILPIKKDRADAFGTW